LHVVLINYFSSENIYQPTIQYLQTGTYGTHTMKYTAAWTLLLASVSVHTTNAFRDQSQKKPEHLKNRNSNRNSNRNLEEECTIDHHVADSAGEVTVQVDPLPSDGGGLFKVSFQDDSYSESAITTYAW
jgi:hypothetical protein